jgi:glycosyltransferase involved in cell wall biosynthesis
MKAMTKVSVILPTYNRSHTLERSIASIFSQTVRDFELLVIDDGSTDGTSDLMKKYEDPRLHYVKNAENRGASAARNVGLDLAQGDYIAFLDSDDEWFPESLERRLTALEESNLQNLGGVASGFVIVTEGKPNHYCRPPRGLNDLIGLNLAVAPQTWILKRDVIDGGLRFDEVLTAFVDWDFLLRLSLHYALETVPEPLARLHHAPNIKRVWSNTNITNSLRKLEKKHAGLLAMRPGTQARFCRSAASYCYSARAMPEVRHWLRLTIMAKKTNPEPYLGLLATLGGRRSFGTYLKVRRSVKKLAGRHRPMTAAQADPI